jgi:hypothetical protein
MGKRCKRRLYTKISAQPDMRADFCSDSMLSDTELSIIDSSEESARLLKQVKDYISEIYSEHKNDLELRRNKRLNSKKPTEYIQPYNLVVNFHFQCRIRLEIQAIVQFSLGDKLKEAVLLSTNEFIEYLSAFLKEFEGKKCLLRAIMLYEVYHTLLNSISQIGTILSELIKKSSFELTNKQLFYEKVACGYFDLIEDVWKKENSRYLDDIVKIKQDLQFFEKGENFGIRNQSNFHSDSTSEGESSSEALHNLSIDELVRFIDTDKKRKKKKNKKSKKVRERLEDEFEKEIELQVQVFKETIGNALPLKERRKPAVSEEFLQMIRRKLRDLKNSNSA